MTSTTMTLDDRNRLADSVEPIALQLAVAVRENNKPLCHLILTNLERVELHALAVVLASHAPFLAAPEDLSDEDVRRAHAAAERARVARRKPEPWVILGDREYRRRRDDRHRVLDERNEAALAARLTRTLAG